MSGQKITDFADESEESQLIKGQDGSIGGIQTTEKEYVRFLRSINAKKETIEGFRSALDDSKKAVRRRMRAR